MRDSELRVKCRRIRKANRKGVLWPWEYVQALCSAFLEYKGKCKLNRTHKEILKLKPAIDEYVRTIEWCKPDSLARN